MFYDCIIYSTAIKSTALSVTQCKRKLHRLWHNSSAYCSKAVTLFPCASCIPPDSGLPDALSDVPCCRTLWRIPRPPPQVQSVSGDSSLQAASAGNSKARGFWQRLPVLFSRCVLSLWKKQLHCDSRKIADRYTCHLMWLAFLYICFSSLNCIFSPVFTKHYAGFGFQLSGNRPL